MAKANIFDYIRYLGCYGDNETRYISSPNDLGLINTNEECIRYCLKEDGSYTYFATQWSVHCVCGKTYGNAPKLDEKSCNMSCAGNSSQMCGGVWAMNLWEFAPGVWSEWIELGVCMMERIFYANQSQNSLTPLSFEFNCTELNQTQHINEVIDQRTVDTNAEIARIQSTKLAALSKLDSDMRWIKAIAYAGGLLGVIIIAVFIASFVCCDFMELLYFLNLMRPGKALIDIDRCRKRRLLASVPKLDPKSKKKTKLTVTNKKKSSTRSIRNFKSLVEESRREMKLTAAASSSTVLKNKNELEPRGSRDFLRQSRIVQMRNSRYSMRHSVASTAVQHQIKQNPAQSYQSYKTLMLDSISAKNRTVTRPLPSKNLNTARRINGHLTRSLPRID